MGVARHVNLQVPASAGTVYAHRHIFNRVIDISGANECARGPFGERFYCLEGSPVAELRHAGTSGFVLGGGIRMRLKGLWLEPEVRWTHWIDRNFGVRDSAVQSDLNQVGFLMGLVF